MGLDWYGVALLLILMVGGALVAQQFGMIPTGSAPGTDINVSVGSGAWDPSWNATVVNIVSGLNLTGGNCTWQGAWNATVQALISAENLMDWNGDWNGTVTQLITENLVWQGTWNSTVTDIVLNHAFSSLNATNLNIAEQLWWNGLNRTDTFAYPFAPYSYEVGVSGSNYYMKNGTTGQVDFWSTEAIAVGNAAIQNTTCGTVFFKAGTFTSTVTNPTLNLKAGVNVVGEGDDATFFKVGNNVHMTLINFKAVSTDQYITLEKFAIIGNKANNANSTAYAIHLDGFQRGIVQYLTINDTMSDAIRLKDSTSGTYTAWQNYILQNKIYYAGENGVGDGINLQNYTPDNEIAGNLIGQSALDGISLTSSGSRLVHNNHIWGSERNGIRINAATRDSVIDNEIETCNGAGIYLDDVGRANIQLNRIWSNSNNDTGHFDGILFLTDSTAVTERGDNDIISGNHVWNLASQPTQNYAINFSISGGADILNLTLSNNDFTGNVAGSVQNVSAVNSATRHIYGNMGFDMGNLIDRAITPYALLWNATVTSLDNAVDNDWTTATGWAYANTTGAGWTYFQFDLAAVYSVDLHVKMGVMSNASDIQVKWYYSNDNLTWILTSNAVILSRTSTTEYVLFGQVEHVAAQYIRLGFYTTLANNIQVRLYEVEMVDFNLNN